MGVIYRYDRDAMRRLHARLARLLPPSFRRRYDAEIGDMLRARQAEIDQTSWPRRACFWLRELSDLVVTIAREWLRLLPSPEDSGTAGPATGLSLPQRGYEMFHDMLGDARYALRTLVRQPLFSLAVVATLALGVGATTAVYTLVDSVLLRPLPYEEPQRLVVGFGSFPLSDSASISPPDYLDYRDRATAFAGLAAISSQTQSLPVGGAGSAETARVRRASHQFFDVIRVAPARGRAFRAEEAVDGAAPVALISDGFWRRRFGADPGVVGSEFLVEEIPTTIVGVLPAGFDFFNNAPDLWMPLPFGADNMTVRRFHFLRVVGRLGDGVRLGAAQEEIDTIARGLAEAYPESNTDWTMRLVPLHEVMVGDVRQPLLLLLGAVGAVLLIVCGNVAVLLLARATRRAPELAVRNALGASGRRVARLLLTESLLLALGGGLLGVAFAYAAVELLIGMSSLPLPRASTIQVDGSVLLFALAVTVGTGLVFGLAPALRAGGRDPGSALREQGRVAGGRQALRHVLVVAQVALSFALLVGAGLLIRSLDSMTRVELGFVTEELAAAAIRLPAGRYEDAAQRRLFFDELLSRLDGAGPIEAAGAVDIAPLSGNGNDTFAYPEGEPPATGTQGFNAQIRSASPGYFDALRIPLVRGRVFTDADVVGSPPVVILDEPFAGDIFPDGDAVGRRIVVDVGEPLLAEVVGVVGGVLHFGATVGDVGTMYFPSGQRTGTTMTVLLRARSDSGAAIEALRSAVAEIDPLIPLDGAALVDEWLADSVAGPRFRARLMAAFALAALLLAAGGLYAVLAYFVAERRREIGLRLALGADAGGVMRLIVRRGLLLVGVGFAIGALAAAALSWSIQGLLFGISAADPVAFGGVAVVLAVAALFACILPALRATRIDPLESLRAD